MIAQLEDHATRHVSELTTRSVTCSACPGKLEALEVKLCPGRNGRFEPQPTIPATHNIASQDVRGQHTLWGQLRIQFSYKLIQTHSLGAFFCNMLYIVSFSCFGSIQIVSTVWLITW